MAKKDFPVLRMALLCLALMFVVSACAPPPIPPAAPGDNPPEKPTSLEGLYRLMVGTGKLTDMTPVPESLIAATYGIAASDMAESVFMVARDVARADEIILIQAIDEEAAGRILQLLSARLARKETETKDSSPSQYALILNAKLLHSGKHLALFVSPDAKELVQVYEENWGK
ncbi:MAG: DUF4358 domain-containing protein [Christensenellales bacterium]|jgi:hypothetical protein